MVFTQLNAFIWCYWSKQSVKSSKYSIFVLEKFLGPFFLAKLVIACTWESNVIFREFILSSLKIGLQELKKKIPNSISFHFERSEWMNCPVLKFRWWIRYLKNSPEQTRTCHLDDSEIERHFVISWYEFAHITILSYILKSSKWT